MRAAKQSNTIIGKNVEINPLGEASAKSGSGGGAPPAGTGGDATKAQGFGGLAAASPLAMSLAENAGGNEPPEIGPDGLPILGIDYYGSGGGFGGSGAGSRWNTEEKEKNQMFMKMI